MKNPLFVPPAIPVIPPPRFNQIVALVQAHFAAHVAEEWIDDSAIIALAPEFALVPGTLKRVKDALHLD